MSEVKQWEMEEDGARFGKKSISGAIHNFHPQQADPR